MKSVDRSKRVKRTGENFTPASLINEMLDKLAFYGSESMKPGKTFCDPACGNGNILVEVLKRKLSLGHDPVTAIGTLYGADIMADNIKECRYRLMSILKEHGVRIRKGIVVTVLTNIVWVSTRRKEHQRGSLDYDFSFNGSNLKDTDVVSTWVEYMMNPDSVSERSLKDKPVHNGRAKDSCREK